MQPGVLSALSWQQTLWVPCVITRGSWNPSIRLLRHLLTIQCLKEQRLQNLLTLLMASTKHLYVNILPVLRHSVLSFIKTTYANDLCHLNSQNLQPECQRT